MIRKKIGLMWRSMILFLDIDGTLVNSKKEITPKTKEALLKVQEMGHIVALASGRPYPGLKKYAEELRLDYYGGYALSFNGGRIISCRTKEVVYEKNIPNSFKTDICSYARKNGLGLMTYEGDNIITESDIDRYMQLEADINHIRIKKVDDFMEYVSFDMTKCLLTAEPDKAKCCEEELAGLLGESLNVFRSEPFFIEVTTKGVDKAESIAGLIRTIGIPYEDTICCGDGFNDLSMIKYAHVGVAMANAQQVVKDNADFITGSCDEDGLVTVIEKFILR